jgi:hypothetical protein
VLKVVAGSGNFVRQFQAVQQDHPAHRAPRQLQR